MTKSFNKFLTRFVNEWSGSAQLYLAVAGGGVSATSLALVPGSSKVLYGVNVLYSEQASKSYLKRFHQEYEHGSMVSLEFAQSLYGAMGNEIGFVSPSMGHPNVLTVAMTSAITSNRYRRGENKAFIVTSHQKALVSLDKLPESLYSDTVIPWRDQQIALSREKQDEYLAEVAIKLATGFEAETLMEDVRIKLL